MSAKDLLGIDDDQEFSDAYNSDEDSRVKLRKRQKLEESDATGSEPESEPGSDDELASEDETPEGAVKPLTKKELLEKQEAIRKSGVVYLSRIPPYMKPQKMKQILERFGPVGRIFLNPEDEKHHKDRVRSGGNRKTKYTEGWAEFTSKKHAKLAAETLNNNKIGGRKGSFYYDDILNIKYLKHFKWTDLTEGIALESQERRERLKAEIAQATKEYKIFAENVERKAMFDNIKAKKGSVKNPVNRTFNQKETHSKKKATDSKDLDDVLSSVF